MQAQTFSGGAHVRDPSQKLIEIFKQTSAQYLLVTERKVYAPAFAAVSSVSVSSSTATSSVSEGRQGLGWLNLEEICSLVQLVSKEGTLVEKTEGKASADVYLLGVVPASGRLALAVDVTDLLNRKWPAVSGSVQDHFIDLRTLLSSTLDPAELALAGHAAALSQWHQAHRFCPRCGVPTAPVDCGTKRQCGSKHRLYPRTDPVVIMLIESPDGQRALLGRSKKVPAGILTCLAGFVDQAESIEEAVARECKEEAGVAINMVQIVGSQPWPIGRAGSCELMLGCVGRAISEKLEVNMEEMDECRWVTRKELEQSIEYSKTVQFSMTGGAPSSPPSKDLFLVPPSWAIAHNLMLHWLRKSANEKS